MESSLVPRAGSRPDLLPAFGGRVEAVEVVSFDFGRFHGMAIKTVDGKHHATRFTDEAKAIEALRERING